MLSVDDLQAGYPSHRIIRGASIEVGRGEIAALVGPNGAGKTTLLRAVMGLIPPAGGKITFQGEDITGWRTDRLIHLGLAYVPEGVSIFPRMTVEQNLVLASLTAEKETGRRLEVVFSLFPFFREIRRKSADHLSGGEKRMLTLARGFMSGPRLLILDDPFLGLSPVMVITLCSFLRDMNLQGLTMLVAGQHVRRILRMSTRAYFLEEGRITMAGSGTQFLRNHHFREKLIGFHPGGG